MADCQLCGRPQRADVSYACAPCGDSTERSLHQAADHWPDLQDSVARLVRHGDPTPRVGKPAPAQPIRPDIGARTVPADHECQADNCEQPARLKLVAAWNGKPILVCPDHQHIADRQDGHPGGLVVNLAASQTADDVRNTATTWARHVEDDRGEQAPTGTVELLRWLAGQVGWIRHQPFAAEALDELGDLGRLVVRAVDRPPPRVDAGECGSATETGPCRNRLSSSPGAAIVHCPVCRATHSATDRRATLLAEACKLMATPTEIAQWLTMLGMTTPGSTVRSWIHRRRLVGSGGWYPFGAAVDLRRVDGRLSRSAA